MKSYVCKFFSCAVAKLTGRDCANYNNCQTHKYYKKYGTGIPLGVGAMMVPPGQLENEVNKVSQKSHNG